MGALPVWLQILLAIIGSLASLAGLVGGIYAARTSIRANRETRAAQTEDKASDWNAGYRAAAERHLSWDAVIVAMLTGMRAEVDVLRANAGLPLHDWPALPDKPPLFPEFTSTK